MTMLRKTASHLLSRLLPRTTASIIVAAALALPAGAGTAIALANTGDTSAVAINTKDGSSVFRLTFGVRQVNGSVVDPQNAAVAIASCADCQTVAISVEVVLAGGDTTTVTPVNEAIAINESCTSCDTLAAAYQFVYALDTKLKLTAQGHQQLAEIRQQLEQLRNSGLSIEQINAEVEALMGQLNSVLNKELIAVNEPAAGPGTETPAITTLNPTPAASPPTDPTTTQTSTPTDTSTTPTTAPTDTTNTGAATGPTDSSMTPTPAPTDTTNTGTATGPTDSSTTPTATPTTATP